MAECEVQQKGVRACVRVRARRGSSFTELQGVPIELNSQVLEVKCTPKIS